ncbi:MAG: hypothetical protein J6T10_27865 [Methanobrevibacter sp.]|nr:hypothetical protein [Methanobrevibacter sp.]
MEKKIKNTLITILAYIYSWFIVIGCIILIPLLVFIYIGWFVTNDIHMDYRAWILIGVITIGLLNYIGFRQK